jgi:hypothetical protein
MISIVTTRYNNETWDANKKYRQIKGLSCIYASPHKLAESIDLDSCVFVIEMNNSKNQIIGIGLIKNKLVTDKVYKIQEDSNYNRYIYQGEHYISREMIDHYNPLLNSILDEILFKGYTHSKRGLGITKLPEKILKSEKCKNLDIKKEIIDLFKYHYKNRTTNHRCST